MTLIESLQYILPSLGVGALTAFLAFKIKLKKQNVSEFQALINEYKILNKDLSDRMDELEIELQRVREQNLELKNKIHTLEHAN